MEDFFNNPLTLAFSLFTVAGIGMLTLTFLTRPQYQKVKVLTDGEYRFFLALVDAVSLLYHVCPQVRLANIVGLKGLFLWYRFRPLGAKCVDFVLLDKKTGETKLVIELDDKSHFHPKRRKRDYFVDYVLASATIPILHETYQPSYNTNLLAKRIQDAING